MNKILNILPIALLMILTICPGVTALAAPPDIQVEVDGDFLKLDVPPLLENGRTLAPIRAIAEKMGAKVDFENASKKVTVSRPGKILILWLGKKEATLNGQNLTMDVPAKEVQGRTLLPLRFVGESLDCKVDWVADKRLVRITSIKDEPPKGNNQGSQGSQAQSLAGDLLKLINQTRSDQSLAPVRLAEPLTKMAQAHSQDMAVNRFLSHTSPTKGGIQARSAAYNLGPVGENLAKGFPDAKSLLEYWLHSVDQSSNIYNPDLRFMGIGVYSVAEAGPDDIYLTAEFAKGTGFFLGPRQQTISGQDLSLQGYAANNQVPLTVYQLNPQDKTKYLSRQTFYPSPGSDGAFQMTVKLWAKGLFLLDISGDQLEVSAL
ncbi:MAG: stalk domain-containing protein [Clostridiales bacterium]|jgi:uncharacterized protein YkwD|nr:stalk domain-containing protein [Clostridiales bacterium]MDR2711756.1 CAP domain-containing protein [Clostridiales bacterium]